MTKVRCGLVVYLCAVSFILGNARSESRKVQMTFVMIVVSWSSAKLNFLVKTAALQTMTSRGVRVAYRSANDWTEE